MRKKLKIIFYVVLAAYFIPFIFKITILEDSNLAYLNY